MSPKPAELSYFFIEKIFLPRSRCSGNFTLLKTAVRVPPRVVDLNAYYGIHHQIIVLSVEAGAIFIQGRTGHAVPLQGRRGSVCDCIWRGRSQLLDAGNYKCGAFADPTFGGARVAGIPRDRDQAMLAFPTISNSAHAAGR